jgi:PAS domain S-box-containing protein
MPKERLTYQALEQECARLKEKLAEHLKAEKEKRDRLRECEKAVEASKDLIAIVDRNYRYRMVNSAFLSKRGAFRDQIIGRTVEDIIGKNHFTDQVKPHLEKCFRGEEVNFEMSFEYPEFGLRDLEVIYFPMHDGRGEVDRAVCIIRDITQRKNNERTLKEAKKKLEEKIRRKTDDLLKSKEALEASNNVKNEFLYNMSHEFRTPMNHIIGFIEILLNKTNGPLNDVQEEYLNDVLKSSKDLHAKLISILELVNLEFQTDELFLENVNIRSLMEECIVNFRETAWHRNIALSLTLKAMEIPVRVDSQKFRRILNSLISNALKFTPSGGTVNIRVQLLDRLPASLRDSKVSNLSYDGDRLIAENNSNLWLNCSVKDSGIGVNLEDQKRLFDRFGQLDASSKKHFQGIGTGLVLAKSFVELHGGQIWVNSEGEGKGSEFQFVVPVQDQG